MGCLIIVVLYFETQSNGKYNNSDMKNNQRCSINPL